MYSDDEDREDREDGGDLEGFLRGFDTVPSQLAPQAQQARQQNTIGGGVYTSPLPADLGSALALDPVYLQMARDASNLADANPPSKADAQRVHEIICKYWLDDINARLSVDRYASVALAESVFGFVHEEDPQLLRLEATYNFHCGIIGIVYEVTFFIKTLYLICKNLLFYIF